MIAQFYALLLANSLYCLGLYKACSFEFAHEDHPEAGIIEGSKNFLWRVKYYSLKYLGPYWSKPICTCPPCMASIHSLYIYWPFVLYMYGFHPIELLGWVLYAGSLIGLNWFLILIKEKLEY